MPVEESNHDLGDDDYECPSDSEAVNSDCELTDGLGVKRLSLIEILRHFAVYTGLKHNHLTYLLRLLKEHQPVKKHSNRK